jgi:hypothetical protein
MLANLPVEVDQRRVDCLEGPFAGSGDEMHDLSEGGFIGTESIRFGLGWQGYLFRAPS